MEQELQLPHVQRESGIYAIDAVAFKR